MYAHADHAAEQNHQHAPGEQDPRRPVLDSIANPPRPVCAKSHVSPPLLMGSRRPGTASEAGHRRVPGREPSAAWTEVVVCHVAGRAGSEVGGTWPLRRCFLARLLSLGGVGSDPSNASTHWVRGSESTSTALSSRVTGMASSAPSGPSTQAQNSRATNVTVAESPTESPMNRGWINDWITMLS